MIWTSYFAKSGRDPRAVSIARGIPKWFKGPENKSLAPSWELLKKYKAFDLTTEQYRDEYQEQLDKLNPRLVGGLVQGKVLCCWEGPGEFCHRQVVGRWLRLNGFEVEELR